MRILSLAAILGVISLAVCSCSIKPAAETESADTVSTDTTRYAELYRPQFHFSPDHNWTNDPNGLVYLDGEYHLFYQYNPYANKWGHMSWGHAVSKDLLHWQHLPVAIPEYIDNATGDSTMIFSGSAVVDAANTSGFFDKDSTGMVAIYTSHLHRRGQQLRQHQSIAYSRDRGRTFSLYEKNPVIDLQLKDFRDPKVIWYAPGKKWVMVTVIPNKFKARFFESKDLKTWTALSDFGPVGDTAKIWECPDLIQLSDIDNPAKKKWVLIISNSHPQGPTYVGMQYFVGEFDGKKFTADNPKRYPLYIDHGKDFYAAVTYNNIPATDGRVVLLGWANNWAYGQDIPTHPWRSAMALPRTLHLKQQNGSYTLIQQPIKEVENLREAPLADLATNMARAIELDYTLTPADAQQSGLKVFAHGNEETVIGYDAARKEVYLDRTRSGRVDFQPNFSSRESVPVALKDGKVKLHIFVDHSLIEVFINEGEQVITDQVFPTTAGCNIQEFSDGGKATGTLQAWTLRTTWK